MYKYVIFFLYSGPQYVPQSFESQFGYHKIALFFPHVITLILTAFDKPLPTRVLKCIIVQFASGLSSTLKHSTYE